MSNYITINHRKIGPSEPVYVIAELSANHNGSKEKAIQLLELAAAAGVDAVKLQTYTADTLTFNGSGEEFTIRGGTAWDGRTLYDLYQEAHTPWEWHADLFAAASRLGVTIFSSPFDATAVDFLKELGCPAYKIASPEIVDLPLIRKAASTGKPLIISTGMASLGEIEQALAAAREAGASEIALLKCTSAYPAPPASMNLRAMENLRTAFGVPVGLSDHTLHATVPIAAVALGANVLEKHFTDSRDEPGPDSAFSMEPHEFTEMVAALRVAEQALGSAQWGSPAEEQKGRRFRRSLYAVADIKAGEALGPHNVRSIRPALGLAPAHYEYLLSRRASQDISAGSPMTWDLVGGPM